MQYANGTFLRQRMPWGLFVAGAAQCPDGKVRKLKRIAYTADTYFSIPASVSYKGKTVAGYATIETVSGSSVALENDPIIVKFIPYEYSTNGKIFETHNG